VSTDHDDQLERIKAEIRAEADAARVRLPLPRHDPPAPPPSVDTGGIERARLDYSIGELTGPDYQAFVELAFRSLLKRDPDDAGSEAQIRLLAAGRPKAEILGNLRWSAEGRRVGTRVRGLRLRYLLAKASRVPLAGYLLDWALALAGLPFLLRHMRGAETVTAARFRAIDTVERERIDAVRAEMVARTDELRGDLHALRARMDGAEQRLATLDARADRLEQRADAAADAQDVAALRHHVHSINHWLVSLQQALDTVEQAAGTEREEADAFAALCAGETAARDGREARDTRRANALAARLRPEAAVFDLGSGDGSGLLALRSHGLRAHGVEGNRVLAERARARGADVAAGEPMEALARVTDGDLDALGLAAAAFAPAQVPALLAHARRVLKPGGCLLVRLEREPWRLRGDDAMADAPAAWNAWLRAAGFDVADDADGLLPDALLARRTD
jgi:SAM-dependent methyltransferase